MIACLCTAMMHQTVPNERRLVTDSPVQMIHRSDNRPQSAEAGARLWGCGVWVTVGPILPGSLSRRIVYINHMGSFFVEPAVLANDAYSQSQAK
jgi:hypothetical protein